MKLQEAMIRCRIGSAIYRKSKPDIRYFNNDPIFPHNIMDNISEKDKKADDWEEWDPRDYYKVNLAL